MQDNREFCEQISRAILDLGVTEAANCMALALVALGIKAGAELEFNCDLGQVVVLPAKANTPPIIF